MTRPGIEPGSHWWEAGRLTAVQFAAGVRNTSDNFASEFLDTLLCGYVVGPGKREILEKTRRPTASSGTIPTCESPVTRPGIEPGSPWWEASVLIAHPPWPPICIFEPQLFVHWSLPQRVASVTSDQAALNTVLATLQANFASSMTCRIVSAYWSLSCVFIGCCPAPGSYGIRKRFPSKPVIGSEACRAGLINCDPIAKATSLYMCLASILSRNENREIFLSLAIALHKDKPQELKTPVQTTKHRNLNTGFHLRQHSRTSCTPKLLRSSPIPVIG
ncbi:hypothetical protein PR048_031191 [Dryococelus australis]|uniref:Uncharacterized protein n=1 Tax=Dryococelus australis TaxID=614101 RepID=A0ABQ9G4J9_9NEOP|nr:hypothetical protein PR048_031191 [Dryococelus australis]